jgi:hypothetical protein
MNDQQEFTWHGAYGQPGSKDRSTKTNGNKGVMAGYRRIMRQQAEQRNAAYQERGCVPADPRYREIHEARLERQAKAYHTRSRELGMS